MENRTIVLGLTGSFGSGCTFIAENFLVQKNFKYISLSNELRSACQDAGLEYEDESQGGRTKLQDNGNKLRLEKGSDFLAIRAYTTICSQNKQNLWVIDSIRNPEEINFFRKQFADFFLIGVFADYEVRWGRKKERYKGNRSLFEVDDKRDINEDFNYGQRVRDCFRNVDYVISNNDTCHSRGGEVKEKIEREINRFLSLIREPDSSPPTEIECNMAAAYAVGQRSSCLKRRVGAVIVDDYGNIFTSGCNDVPLAELPCFNIYGQCYRDKEKESFFYDLEKIIPAEGDLEKVKNLFNSRWKILDKCRALHGEEKAILNLAHSGRGIQTQNAILYTTTYPCNLCANKIVEIKIKKVVYFEPYPVKEAQITLANHGIDQEMFTGVTFNGYFRCFGRRLL